MVRVCTNLVVFSMPTTTYASQRCQRANWTLFVRFPQGNPSSNHHYRWRLTLSFEYWGCSCSLVNTKNNKERWQNNLLYLSLDSVCCISDSICNLENYSHPGCQWENQGVINRYIDTFCKNVSGLLQEAFKGSIMFYFIELESLIMRWLSESLRTCII